MKCDRCGKESVYHSTLIVNGVSQTTNLCRECALKEGVFNAGPSGMFEDLFSAFSDFLPFEKVADKECPVCKTTLREFRNSGRLGCPNCYEAFRENIDEVLKKVAPFDRHKQITSTKKTRLNKTDKIAELRSQMAQAVSEERYEDAGKIKKQIQKLESKDE